MPAPDVHELTARVYDALPEVYRTADEQITSGSGYPLLRFLSLVLDQAGAVADVVERLDYVPLDDPDYDAELDAEHPTSDLVDPATADPAWLAWLGQLVGTRVDPLLTEADRRESLAATAAGWQAGTRADIVAATRSVLTGARSVTVYPTPGNPYAITVITLTGETPGGPSSVLDAIEAAGARPAGVTIAHSYYSASWATLETAYDTWAQIDVLTFVAAERT